MRARRTSKMIYPVGSITGAFMNISIFVSNSLSQKPYVVLQYQVVGKFAYEGEGAQWLQTGEGFLSLS